MTAVGSNIALREAVIPLQEVADASPRASCEIRKPGWTYAISAAS